MICFSENTLRQVETCCLSIGFGAMEISFKSESLINISDSKRYNSLRCANFATHLTPSSSKISSPVFSVSHKYFSTDKLIQKANVYSSVNQGFSGIVGYNSNKAWFKINSNKAWFTRLPSHVIAFTSAGTDVMTWTVNSVCSNKKANVNFEVGINFVRNFGPPWRHIDIIPSIVWANRDGLSIDLPDSCLPWYSNIFWYILHHGELCILSNVANEGNWKSSQSIIPCPWCCIVCKSI